MRAVGAIGRVVGRLGRRLALRSRWLARRLWMVMVVDVLFAARRHWKRLEPGERDRLVELARKSAGRPSKKLSARERREAVELLEKAGHIEFAGSVAGVVLPFEPVSRRVTGYVARRAQRGRPGDRRPPAGS